MRLPVELLEHIISNVAAGENLDVESLRSCSYASGAFRTLAQRHLFSSIAIEVLLVLKDSAFTENPDTSIGRKFLDLISDPESAHIAPLVQTLWIRTADWEKEPYDLFAETEDTQILPKWYTETTKKKPLSIEYILPKLKNLQSLRLDAVSTLLPVKVIHAAASQSAIVRICETKITSLDSYSFPFPGFTGSEGTKLRQLAIYSPPNPMIRLRGPVHLETLCVLPSPWVCENIHEVSSWIKQQGCPIDVTRLRRLVLHDWMNVPPDYILPLCAGTLEELNILPDFFRDHGQYLEYPGIQPSHLPDPEAIPGSPVDLESLVRLTTLKIVIRYRLHRLEVYPDGNAEGEYYTTLLWTAALLRNIADDSPLKKIILEFAFEFNFYDDDLSEMVVRDILFKLDFSPLKNALLVGSDGDERMRCRNLTGLHFDFRVQERRLSASAGFHEHHHLQPFLRLGICRITYGMCGGWIRTANIFEDIYAPLIPANC